MNYIYQYCVDVFLQRQNIGYFLITICLGVLYRPLMSKAFMISRQSKTWNTENSAKPVC